MKMQDKIQEIKQRAAPINYSSVSVNEMGALVNRESLLEKRIVEGYAVIWGRRNTHGEIFERGAFSNSIKQNGPGSGAKYEIKFLYNHKQDEPLSLFEEIKENEIGLYFRTVPLDPVPIADTTLIRLKSRTLNNFSQGFNFIWDNNKLSYDEKTDSLIVKEAILYEISVATIPSGMDTYAVRSIENIELLHDDTEDFITSLPRSKQLEARQIFARHKTLLNTEPFEQRNKTLIEKPHATGIRYDYLLNNLKI